MAGNPPDKTGYKVITLVTSDSDEQISQLLTDARAEGFEFVAVIGNRVILENYKKS